MTGFDTRQGGPVAVAQGCTFSEPLLGLTGSNIRNMVSSWSKLCESSMAYPTQDLHAPGRPRLGARYAADRRRLDRRLNGSTIAAPRRACTASPLSNCRA